jgi:hypothetical protein
MGKQNALFVKGGKLNVLNASLTESNTRNHLCRRLDLDIRSMGQGPSNNPKADDGVQLQVQRHLATVSVAQDKERRTENLLSLRLHDAFSDIWTASFCGSSFSGQEKDARRQQRVLYFTFEWLLI